MKNKVCIVTPFHKDILNKYERLSLQSIYDTFPYYEKFLVTFKENDLNFKYFNNIFFDINYFKSIKTYNQLCFNLDFYQKFIDFDYILVCHLDVICLHSDYLQEIIDKNLSYIGAPAGKKNIFDRKRKKLWGRRFFCNGGFSLRKTSDFINVLKSNNLSFPFNYYTIYECMKSGFIRYLKLYMKTFNQKDINKAKFFTNNFYLHEDTFWTYFATIFYDKFKLPTTNEANKFCFDGDPYFFYKKNNYKLPMALHGHYDYPDFLEKIEYKKFL